MISAAAQSERFLASQIRQPQSRQKLPQDPFQSLVSGLCRLLSGPPPCITWVVMPLDAICECPSDTVAIDGVAPLKAKAKTIRMV